jgi:hypothetical protein
MFLTPHLEGWISEPGFTARLKNSTAGEGFQFPTSMGGESVGKVLINLRKQMIPRKLKLGFLRAIQST